MIDGRPSASSDRPQRTLTTTSQRTGPPRVTDHARVPVVVAVVRDESREPQQAVRAPAPHGVELRRGVEPRLVGLHDPKQPVALEVAVGRQPVRVGRDPRLVRRIADRDPPRPRQQRRLDRLGHLGRAVAHVVEEPPPDRDRPVPEDRVADEPARALGGEQRLELGARPRGVEVAPGDRGEARVPVPLPRVAQGARPRVRVGHAGALSRRPVLAQDRLGLGLDGARRGVSRWHAASRAAPPRSAAPRARRARAGRARSRSR